MSINWRPTAGGIGVAKWVSDCGYYEILSANEGVAWGYRGAFRSVASMDEAMEKVADHKAKHRGPEVPEGLRQKVARTLYENTGGDQPPPWDGLSPERQAGWLSDADAVIPVVTQFCADIMDLRDPLGSDYQVSREQVGHMLRRLYLVPKE